MKNILLSQQDRPRQRQKTLSRAHPGHEQRMAAHVQRVAAEMPNLTEPANYEATYIDPNVDIPPEAVDVFRFRTFQMAHRRSDDILDPLERFVHAIVDSSRPVTDPSALRQWYEQIYVPRLEVRMARRAARLATQDEAANVSEVAHACV